MSVTNGHATVPDAPKRPRREDALVEACLDTLRSLGPSVILQLDKSRGEPAADGELRLALWRGQSERFIVQTTRTNLSYALAAGFIERARAAYLDRPAARTKDLQDLAHILAEYPANEDDRLYGDDIFESHLDDRQARAFVLGREIRALVDEDDRDLVLRFIETISQGEPSSTFAANSPWHRHEDREHQVALRLEALRRGLGL